MEIQTMVFFLRLAYDLHVYLLPFHSYTGVCTIAIYKHREISKFTSLPHSILMGMA